MEILLFFIFVSLCSFGLLMIAERIDEAIFVGPVLLFIGLLITMALNLIDKADSGEGKEGQSANVVLMPYSPMAQNIELTMPEIMTAVSQIARAEQGEMNYVLRENIGMPAISYHNSRNFLLAEEALPVATPITKKNNSEHSIFGFEFRRVLNTVLVLFALAIIVLGFMVFNLRNNLEQLSILASHRVQHCEALASHLKNQISVLETNLALSQMNSGPAADVPVEKSTLSVHDSASSVLKMRRRLELD